MTFQAKNCILGKYLYVCHTLFILYLKGNHTLFGEKLYSIWKFSSENTAPYSRMLYPSFRKGKWQILHVIMIKLIGYSAFSATKAM